MKCKHCRQSFEPERKGQKACSIECAQGIVQAEHEKAFNRKTREMKRALRESDTSYWSGRAKKSCHDFIRARDMGKKCKSCDKMLLGKFDAGHFYSSGKYPLLRYDERNIHGQCSQCNSGKMKGGNLLEYRIGLIAECGDELVLELDALSRNSAYKYTIPIYQFIEQYYKDKLKALDTTTNQRNNES